MHAFPPDTTFPSWLRPRRPEELLQHELCEEVVVAVPVRGGEVASATVFRGPRLKTGIDIGPVVAQLHTITGRMTYRGKVMNRAARISAAASSGQVWMWIECRVRQPLLRPRPQAQLLPFGRRACGLSLRASRQGNLRHGELGGQLWRAAYNRVCEARLLSVSLVPWC